jgi:hypothetical protein
VLKRHPLIAAGLACAALLAVVIWLVHVRQAGHWLKVHTGTIDEPGPYYGFWSGFGSDLEEFGILGAIAAGIYQLVKSTTVRSRAAGGSGSIPRPEASSCSAIATISTTSARSQLMSSSNGRTVNTPNARPRCTGSSARPAST